MPRTWQGLSRTEALLILDLIGRSLSCKTEDEFRQVIVDTRDLIEYDHAVCGMGKLDENSGLLSYQVVNVSYPEEWLKVYVERRYDRIDPIMKENLTTYRIQWWNETYKKHDPPRDFLSAARDFGLGMGCTSGAQNRKDHTASLFSFASKKMKKSERTRVILDHLIPHYHLLLSRLCDIAGRPQSPSLTVREKEIMKWLKEGKTSWEISMILNISESTVNFHTYNVMRKLGCVNRAQLIAAVMQFGLVDFE